ncbi:hypothetical protein EXIGLDRAFT_782659 [Exidia glandulosa HHB12029]|uniref:Uncharacterized protein n=1 Tax=Exidia glandulosa HHB12029 TaxID=1314781 RepID=A0A166NII7_EXIGL|nr:hypothetical protein EXIGLDRAFT_782659 [Exidia glandulosa HHB12029]
MRGIIDNPALLRCVKKFGLILRSDIPKDKWDNNKGSSFMEMLHGSTSAQECTRTLVQLLRGARKLQHLALLADKRGSRTYAAAIFQSYLADTGLRLDQVVSLTTSGSCTVLAEICPSITSLDLNVRYTSQHAVTEEVSKWATRTGVRSLTINGGYQLDYIEALTRSLPHLTELSFDLYIALPKELPRLQHLRGLRKLTLGALSRLGVGYNPPPNCGPVGWSRRH